MPQTNKQKHYNDQLKRRRKGYQRNDKCTNENEYEKTEQ